MRAARLSCARCKTLKSKAVVFDKFTHLLVSLVVLIALAPFVELVNRGFPFYSLLWMAVIVLTLRAMTLQRSFFAASVALAAAVFLLELLTGSGFFKSEVNLLGFLSLTLYALFIASAIFILSQRIFSAKFVDTDKILGGLCVYLLIGVFWTLAYQAITFIVPGALGPSAAAPEKISTLFYFSFTTLTTLGYGDILPNGDLARFVAMAEALVGQIFLTVFIAKLVGLSIARELAGQKD